MKTARVFPLPKSIDEIRSEYIKKIDTFIGGEILKGFKYKVDGIEYHFNYTMEDQNNFSTAITECNYSLQLGMTDHEKLKAIYGSTKDGDVDESALPVPLPEKYIRPWNGWLPDGSNKILFFTAKEFQKLFVAAGSSVNNKIALGWGIKDEIRKAKTLSDLENILKKYKIPH